MAKLVRISRSGLGAALCAATLAFALPSAASEPRVPHYPHGRSTTVSDVLVVRGRAGLPPELRRAIVTATGSAEVGSIEALGATIIRVPRARRRAVETALRRSGYFKSVERDHLAAAMQIPNDPDFASEWGLTQIQAPSAWDVTMGSSNVTVAVVDSGVDFTHPDLSAQLLPGYDFVNNDADPSDDNGHGTRMAGVIGAEASNGIGVVGVAPHCKLLPIKVLGADGYGSYSAIASGITYAVDHGARIINLSLAGTAPSTTLQSAVDYAAARGAVVVAAAGNYGTGETVYPAAFPNAVAVGATDESDTVASFSDFGSWLALVAPGLNIMTTNWTGNGGAPYVASSGTSPAAAFASGALALLISAHPELSNTAAVAALTSTAHDVGTTGWDPDSGWGRVDVAAALGLTPAPAATPLPSGTSTTDSHAPSVSITTPPNNSLVYGPTSVDVAASDDVGVTRVDLTADNVLVASDTAPPFGFLWDTTGLAPGRHTLRTRAYDAAGNQKLSRTVRVRVTDGVGLAVTRARLSLPRSGSTAGATLSVAAMFVLPDGVALDQTTNTFVATLSSGSGTLLTTPAQGSALITDTRGRLGLTVASTDTSSATVKVLISTPKKQPYYLLTMTAKGLNLTNLDSIMGLTMTINGATLSQSISFRVRPTSYVFP